MLLHVDPELVENRDEQVRHRRVGWAPEVPVALQPSRRAAGQWANVSILLLVRSSDAVRDVAVRTALGASRWRVVRVVLVESLIVGGLGSGAGVWLASMASGILAGTLPATFSVSFGLDVTVMAFACLLGLTVSVVSSLPSVLRSGRVDVIGTLKDGGRSGGGRSRLRSGLVVAQVALAAGFALAAGLTARSVAAASSIPFGFDPEGRTLVTTTLSGQGYTDDRGQVFIGNALARLRSVPGVQSASTLQQRPVPLRLLRGRVSTSRRRRRGSLSQHGYQRREPRLLLCRCSSP